MILALQHNYVAPQLNQHYFFGQASLCEGGFIWVQLTHIPPTAAQIHE